MIEKIVMEHLRKYVGVPVYPCEPEEKPERYIIVEKTGGGRENWIESATIAVQSHAESIFQAALLNERAKLAMITIIEQTNVSRCELNTDYNFTDTQAKKWRYQAVFDLTYMT